MPAPPVSDYEELFPQSVHAAERTSRDCSKKTAESPPGQQAKKAAIKIAALITSFFGQYLHSLHSRIRVCLTISGLSVLVTVNT